MPKSDEQLVRKGKGFVLNKDGHEYVLRWDSSNRFPSATKSTTMQATSGGKMAVYAEDDGPDWTLQLSFYRKPTDEDIQAMLAQLPDPEEATDNSAAKAE